jgi:hypothetical protein
VILKVLSNSNITEIVIVDICLKFCIEYITLGAGYQLELFLLLLG